MNTRPKSKLRSYYDKLIEGEDTSYQPPEGCDEWTEEQWQDHFKRKQEIIDGFKQLKEILEQGWREKNG
jgi:hypothetical protein